MNGHVRGALVVAAIAGLFVGGKVLAAETPKAGEGTVKCFGLEECKGMKDCEQGAGNCEVSSECKGSGWIETTAQDCESRGGAHTD